MVGKRKCATRATYASLSTEDIGPLACAALCESIAFAGRGCCGFIGGTGGGPLCAFYPESVLETVSNTGNYAVICDRPASLGPLAECGAKILISRNLVRVS